MDICQWHIDVGLSERSVVTEITAGLDLRIRGDDWEQRRWDTDVGDKEGRYAFIYILRLGHSPVAFIRSDLHTFTHHHAWQQLLRRGEVG